MRETKPSLMQLRALVGNPNVYALQQDDGSYRPYREPLAPAVLQAHLAGNITVGTYVGHRLSDGRTVARTLVFDVDQGYGGEAEGGDPSLGAARRIIFALDQLGLPERFIGLEFSGKKGYHVWVVLQHYRPNAELRRLGRAALVLADVECEMFPKQDEVRDLGNLVKLPGGVHRVTGRRNDFLGPVPAPVPSVVWERVLAGLPPEVAARQHFAPHTNRFPCLETISEGVSEGGRNTQLFHLATMFRRHGATEDVVRAILEHINSKNDPPLDDIELEHIVTTSAYSGPVCSQLPGALQDACGDQCIRKVVQGLYTRPGQVRHADIGEAVVVRVAERAGRIMRFEHDDLESAKGALRYGN